MRIAIYSRKSRWTGRGDSVENQAAMCREYIQRYLLPENVEGEMTPPEILVYEDEGFSGKNTKRPEFQRMMRDIQERRYDYLVCYRLDRLGRNMIDLATLVEELNRREISFISIKEQFDTSTPMGKAMLYFAGVLAQMEREQIAERVRDNMLMLARSGRWLGGNTPLGFLSAEEKKMQMDGKVRKTWRLQVKDDEIPIVKRIFQLYLEEQSLGKVAEYFQVRQIRTRKNKEYTVTAVRDILRNPVYCCADQEGYAYFYELGCQVCMEPEEAVGENGFICYAKTVSGHKENPPEKWILAVGKHPGIVGGKDFVKVQKLLEKNRFKGDTYRIHNEIALLSGLLYCSCGHAMRPKYYGRKSGKEMDARRFSYICPYKYQTHGQHCQVPNIQGNTLDQQVCQEILHHLEQFTNWNDILRQVYKQLNDLPNHGNATIFSETDAEAAVLRQQIEQNRVQIQNLIHSLAHSAASPEFVRQVEKEIQEKEMQIQQLEKEYQGVNVIQEAMYEVSDGEENNEEGEDAKHGEEGRHGKNSAFSQILSAFSGVFQELSVPQKREFLKQVIERITWDGVSVSCTLHYHTRWDPPVR